MKNNTTEIVSILDMSGSMYALTADTIGGFNSMIASQKKKNEGKAYVTTVVFNSSTKTVHDRIDLEKVEPMTEEEYCPSGCTALVDAMGETIERISTIHKYARPEDIPEHTIFMITTDGMENASHRYTADQLREMVEEKKKLGWEFIFFGANIDSVSTAKRYGFSESNTVDYVNDSVGNSVKFEAMDCAVSACRASAPLSGSGWRRKVDADYKKRGNGEKS